MKIVGIITFGVLAIATTALPIDDLAKLGVAGGCLAIVFWLVAKTIPQIVTMHGENLTNLTSAYRQSVADTRQLHHDTTNKLCEHLDNVEKAITDAAKNESALLRELIKDHR